MPNVPKAILSPRIQSGLVEDDGSPSYGLPENWTPIDATVTPGGSPPAAPAMPPTFQGSVPIALQLPTDLPGTTLASNPSVPSNRLVPLSASGIAAVNSAVSVQTAPVATAAAAAQTTATTALTTAQKKGFQGAWIDTTAYMVGAEVDFMGAIYLCILANTNQTPPNATYWLLLSGSSSYAGVWSSVIAYTVGQIVSVSSSLYISIQNSTNEDPTSTTGYWQELTGTSIYEGAWSIGVAYSVGQTVSYTDGNFYICVSANTGQAPVAVGSSYWSLLGTSNTLIGAYNGSTAYTAGNEVTNSGNIFQALQATTGNAPPTPPATNAYWQLMGPTTLTAVPDGPTVYGGTSGGASYRPLSNPLSSLDAGANVTIDIAAFSMRVRNRSITSDVSYNSGSVTSLSYGTLYYIYCNDASFAGGSVTYSASTTKENALDGSGYLFIGSILTTVSGGGETTGNNDGGSGAQYGNVVLVHPSTATGSFTNTGNAIDGNPATAASCSGANQALTVSGFSGLVLPGVTAIYAFVDWFSNASGGSPTALIQVSTNGGGSFTTVYSTSSTFSRTQTLISLGAYINPSLYQIRVETGTGVTLGGIDVYEIFLQEVY